MGDQAAAEQQFREALRIQPGIAEWRLNLARVLATRGEIPEARFQFEQAIRLKPDSAEARLDYGRLLSDRGELAAAIGNWRPPCGCSPISGAPISSWRWPWGAAAILQPQPSN